ncbi:MAG: radical SAM protein [Bryobacteraceae bacterium]|nr:radical SAM protein [Bryobacteraceae bacterium]
MADRTRPYLFYDTCVSLCTQCFRKVEGKILFEDGHVYMTKRCPIHGSERVLMADDIDYYKRCREVFLKPPEIPNRWHTPIEFGCPYDCGLCPDHEQHSCLTLVELTDHCNLRCPVCYAGSGPHREGFRSLPEIERILDGIVESETKPDVVQLSGGEPTLHPEFFAVLDACKRRPIQHLMVNTNGVRIATDEDFTKKLADYMPDFEIYLQFDSLQAEPLLRLRGADLRGVRQRALERLNRLGISTTLVVTVQRGLNDGELGTIVEFGLTQPCVRGVTFQPIQAAGRLDDYDPVRDRLTLTEVRRRILEQTSTFRPEDILPVPCHPETLAMAYALKTGDGVVPLTGSIDPKVLIEGGRNTIVYEQDTALQRHLFQTFSTAHSPASWTSSLKQLLCCLPGIEAPAGLTYANVFRVLIVQFIDAYSFETRSIKKTCVHIAQPDGRMIPFDTFNLFYRDGLAAERLEPLRREAARV